MQNVVARRVRKSARVHAGLGRIVAGHHCKNWSRDGAGKVRFAFACVHFAALGRVAVQRFLEKRSDVSDTVLPAADWPGPGQHGQRSQCQRPHALAFGSGYWELGWSEHIARLGAR